MQKKIIGLAIVGLASSPVFAAESINMYGVLDAGVVGVSASGQQSQSPLAVSGGLSASRVGVKASEGLDGGMTAVAVMEYGLDTETSQNNTNNGSAPVNNVVARQQLFGLASSFGTVATGYLQTTGFDFGMKYDVLADSLISPLQSVTGAGASFLIGSNAAAARAQRAVAYISPKFGDFSFAANYATALAGVGNAGLLNTVSSTNQTAALASGCYDKGPLSVGLVYATLAVPASGSTSTTVAYNISDAALGASYNFVGKATLKATFQSSNVGAHNGSSSTNSAYSLGAVVPVGVGEVVFSYAANSIAAVGKNSSSALSASGYTLAYLKSLSKSTTAYISYAGVTNGSATGTYTVGNNMLTSTATATFGGTSNIIGFGLNKKF